MYMSGDLVSYVNYIMLIMLYTSDDQIKICLVSTES